MGGTARCIPGVVSAQCGWKVGTRQEDHHHSRLQVWPGVTSGFMQSLCPSETLLAVGWWVGSSTDTVQEGPSPPGGRVLTGGSPPKHLFLCRDQTRSVYSCHEGPSPVVSSHISRCSRVICHGTKLAPNQRLLELNPSCHMEYTPCCVWLGEEEEEEEGGRGSRADVPSRW